ncbi:MAG TPA: hypothetical protein VNQ73_15175 [Ilumatobacter sp.]|nr:hypothetical protein [Ilumatobacter sp.]
MKVRGRAQAIGTTVTRRAWSSIGRMADALAASRMRRAYAVSTRFALHLTGCAVIAIGVGLMLWNNFGPGPLDVLIGTVRNHSGLPLTLAVWATTGTLLLVAWALGKRPGFGNLVTILAVGPLMQLTVTVLSAFGPPEAMPAQVALHVVATAVVGLGAGMNLVARLGAGTSELLASSLAQRTGFTEPRVRMACELTWLAVGALLGGPFGVGTVIVALLIGPFVATGFRTVDTAVTSARVATRRQIEWARTPLGPVADITGQIPVMSISAGE